MLTEIYSTETTWSTTCSSPPDRDILTNLTNLSRTSLRIERTSTRRLWTERNKDKSTNPRLPSTTRQLKQSTSQWSSFPRSPTPPSFKSRESNRTSRESKNLWPDILSMPHSLEPSLKLPPNKTSPIKVPSNKLLRPLVTLETNLLLHWTISLPKKINNRKILPKESTNSTQSLLISKDKYSSRTQNSPVLRRNYNNTESMLPNANLIEMHLLNNSKLKTMTTPLKQKSTITLSTNTPEKSMPPIRPSHSSLNPASKSMLTHHSEVNEINHNKHKSYI